MPGMPTSSTIPVKHKSTSPYLFLPLTFLLGLAAGYLIWGFRVTPVDTESSATRRVDVSAGDSPALGPGNAPITIIEFSDYQCPYCKLWHDNVYDRLLANYPGKIRFVYRDFPLPGHPEALPAAEAAHCAGQQNVYWKYHDALFGQQFGLGRTAYEEYARELGLDMAAFSACLDSGRYQAGVSDVVAYATSLGVQSTPTFFINGIPVVGAEPYETFKQIIDKELAGKN
jgi:protein-disulfide isomerase